MKQQISNMKGTREVDGIEMTWPFFPTRFFGQIAIS